MALSRSKIVLYHGVTDERGIGTFNYRGKFIAPTAFAKQLAWMKRHYTVLPLSELIFKLQNGTLPKNALAITFDDGYVNNYSYAFQLLREAGLPATFFITTGFIDGTPLGVDIIEHAIGTTTREDLTLQLRGRTQTFQLQTRAERIETDLAVRVYLKTLAPNKSAAFLKELVTKTGVDLSTTLLQSPYRPLTWEQIKEMEAAGMTFAPHTVTHPILSHCSQKEAQTEIAESQKKLAEKLAHPLNIFAYPNGGKSDYNAETISILKEAGFSSALTTEPKAATSKSDTFSLPRYTLDGTNEWYRFRLKISDIYYTITGV